MLRRLLYKLCQGFDVSLLYHSPVGVKCTNQLVRSERFARFARSEVISLAADRLRLGFDALMDEHTLLGAPTTESPHFTLVAALQGGQDVASSLYARRVSRGTLDFRPARRIDGAWIRKLGTDCERTVARVRSGEVEPVITVQVRGTYYIADGKHRAAVCAWLGAPCPCVDASLLIHDSFYWWVQRKMQRRPSCYSKHLRWFASLEDPSSLLID